MKKQVTMSEFSRLTEYAKSTISALVRSGVLVLDTGGKLDLAKNLHRLRAHESGRQQDGATDKTLRHTATLRAGLLAKRIEMLDHELKVMQNRVHDKVACCQSLTAIRAAESMVWHGLAKRFAGAFPEAIKQAGWIDAEVDAIMARLSDGRAYEVQFKCPRCNEPVENLVAEAKQ